MKISRVCSYIATVGPIGYLYAPGTMATLVSMPFVYFLQWLFEYYVYFGFIFILFFLSIVIVNKALVHFKGQSDPSEIVFDEVIGCLLTFWGIPFSFQSALVGFLLFRFFDIAKIGGINRLQNCVGAWGIMLDDVGAAVVANLILRFLFL